MPKKFTRHLISDDYEQISEATTDIFLNDDGAGETAQNTVSVKEITVLPGRRELNAAKVEELVGSIKELGLINPITITEDNKLVAGAHRLQAFKDMGLEEIPVTYLKTENEMLIELAEIDENLIRSEMHYLENGKALARRKEIYENLHPETKRGGDRKSEKIKTSRARFDNDSGIVLSGDEQRKQQTDEQPRSFAEDTAIKTGFTARKIQEDIQINESLTARAKEAIVEQEATKKEALYLSRLKPEKQEEIIDRIAEAGSLTKAIRIAKQEAMKALPKFEPRKNVTEDTDEEKQLYRKKSRIISRVKETAEHLKHLDENALREHEIKSVVQIYKGKNGEYTFSPQRVKRGDSGYIIPDGYSVYIYNDTERIILNEHGLICYLGTDKNNDVPVIIDGDVMYEEDRKIIAFAREQ